MWELRLLVLCPLSRGDIIEQPPVILPMLNETLEEENETTSSILNPQHTLYSSGPEILLYFYSDEAIEGPGFELAYWYITHTLPSALFSCLLSLSPQVGVRVP